MRYTIDGGPTPASIIAAIQQVPEDSVLVDVDYDFTGRFGDDPNAKTVTLSFSASAEDNAQAVRLSEDAA